MASETVDQIDWSHPPTIHRAVPPELHVLHTAMRAANHKSCCSESAANVRLQNARPTHCRCGHSGYITVIFPIVLNCDLSHRRSVAVLCMLYKIRCNPKHPLCCCLPVPYVPVRVTRGALIAHRYTFAPPRCRTSQYRRTFIALSVSLWNDLVDPVFDGVGLAGFKTRSNAFLLA